MSESNDHAGIFGILFCVVVLVIAAIALSVITDKRMGMSSNKIALAEDIANFDIQIVQEQNKLDSLKVKYERLYKNQANHSTELQKVNSTIAKDAATIIAKKSMISHLQVDVKLLGKELSEHSVQYRNQQMSKAVGEKNSEIQVKSGKIYTEVTITKVTAAGIEITHKTGLSRIPTEELDRSWHERFLWTDAQR